MKHVLMSVALLLLISGCKPGSKKDKEDVCETDMAKTEQLKANASVVNIPDSIRLYYSYPLSDGTDYSYTFLEFGAIGCAPCKKMEKEMQTIREEMTEKVNVRFLNLTKKWNRPWADYFDIQTIPTQIILDHHGKEIYRHIGYIPADELKKVFK